MSEHEGTVVERPALRLTAPAMPLRRALLAALTIATAGSGALLMASILGGGGWSGLEAVILLLFTATFAWIVLSFWNATIGFVLTMLGRDPLSLRRLADLPSAPGALVGRTALAMPIHNEDPHRVMAGLEATLRSLEATGEIEAFELHLLSDTTDERIARRELAAWQALRGRWGRTLAMHYRRREANAGRKAGNLAEFCLRAGHRYDYLVVLDADSVMTGGALTTLARLMDANPAAGILQTVPYPTGQGTIFGRVLQFAAWLYAPIHATGQAFWQGDAANYWGHNAILRMRPFVEHCRLPVLPGRAPLGGEIISHDFVEAAWMRRAGHGVWLLPWIEGSHEQIPANIPDYARRDRRWSQGSLQHLRLLGEPGLHPLSRLHFLSGAMGYVSSLLWLLLLLAGTVYVGLDDQGVTLPSLDHPALAQRLEAVAAWRPISLLAVTAAILFVPRGLALLAAVIERRGGFGGTAVLLAGAIAETGFSVLLAPVMMLFHSRFVASVLAGRAVAWDPQRRDGADLSWRDALRAGGWIGAAGALWTAVTLLVSPGFALWLSPILSGLLLAVPMIRWSARGLPDSPRRGSGMLRTPADPGGARPRRGARVYQPTAAASQDVSSA